MILKSMKNKKIIVIFILIIVAAIVGWQFFGKEKKPKFETAKAEIGNVLQEVSETGKVIEGEAIKLTFKNSGQIEKIYVAVGEKVKTGDVLAKTKNSELYFQLEEAKAAVAIYQAQLNKLLAGASQEEIQLAETAVSNAEVSLNEAKKNLENIIARANDSLQSAYQNAFNVLDDAYLKAYNSLTAVDSIQRDYFMGF
jgi:multidrug efflux pump subunit AcrA (membrane-fusion protein)